MISLTKENLNCKKYFCIFQKYLLNRRKTVYV